MNRLEGKIAVVTGGNSGIGLATAKRFHAEGANVVIVGRNAKKIAAAADEVGEKATSLVADVSRLADLDNLAAELKSKFGRVDILFANAGIAPTAPFVDTDESTFDQLFATNVKGVYFNIQKLLPVLVDGAAVVINSSIANTKGIAGFSAYSGTKAAVRSFARTMAAELAPRKIRVNTVSPGPIDTPLFGKIMSEEDFKKFEADISSQVPLGRFGTADEIASAVAFLASDDASYVTGADLYVDGGMAQI